MVPATGEFIVAWSGAGASDDSGIFAQRYDEADAPIGGEFRVNAQTTNAESGVGISLQPTALGSGQFVVVYNEQNLAKVRGQRFTQAHGGFGTLGAEIEIGNGLSPAVAMDSTGDFLVAWQSNVLGIAPDVKGAFFDSTGVRLGQEFTVNTFTTDFQFSPSVTTLATGKHVVVWRGDEEDGDSGGIFGQRFNRNGDANGDASIDVNDVFYLVNFLFAGGAAPLGPSNVDGVASVDVNDVFYLINFLFAGGPAPV